MYLSIRLHLVRLWCELIILKYDGEKSVNIQSSVPTADQTKDPWITMTTQTTFLFPTMKHFYQMFRINLGYLRNSAAIVLPLSSNGNYPGIRRYCSSRRLISKETSDRVPRLGI